MRIPFFKPDLPSYEDVEKDFREAYDAGWLGVPGKFTDRFEAAIKEYINVRHVILVNNCSTALMAMLSHIPDGSKVIIPAYTFRATLQALEWNRLIPVVVDVDDSGNILSEGVEAALIEYGKSIKAILAVHMFGNPCFVEGLRKIANRYNVELFFDAAHALGAEFGGEKLGGNGRAEAFSIAVTKPLAAGEGGIITTNYDSVAARVNDVVWHGLRCSLDTRYAGLNGHIQEINSIMGYHGLQELDVNLCKRRELSKRYCAALPENVAHIPVSIKSAAKDFVIYTKRRNNLASHLMDLGIGTKKYFYPAVPDMGTFAGVVHSAANAYRMSNECLALPLYCSLTKEEQDYVIKAIKEFFDDV